MKNLKPIASSNNVSNLIATSVVDELTNKIAELRNANEEVLSLLEELKTEVDSNTITKENGTFNQLNADNIETERIDAGLASIGHAVINRTNTGRLDTSEINSGYASITDISANQEKVENLTATNARIKNLTLTDGELFTNKINADNIEATNGISADSGTFDRLTASTLHIDDLNASNLYPQNVYASGNIQARGKSVFDEAKILLGNIEELHTQNQNYLNDDTDATQFVRLEQTSSPDVSNDYKWIEIPAVKGGVYRIDVKKDSNNEYFGMTFINTETAPIVQYSRNAVSDIDVIYWNPNNGNWYVKTYASGYIYWGNDSRDPLDAPKTYAELPVSEEGLFKEVPRGKSRLVVMGDGSFEYGITVNGVVETNYLIEMNKFQTLWFYGNSWEFVKKFLNNYGLYVDADGDVHPLRVETAGYLFHTDDNYLDEFENKMEALEKVKWDGRTATFVLDADYGQDEIKITDEDMTDDTLPFTICFTANTMTWDSSYNKELINQFIKGDD